MQNDMFNIRGVPKPMLDVLQRMHGRDPDRWAPRRAIFANWWLFDDQEEILFGNGNLMLTGRNESGKTSVLVALLNLVLDRDWGARKIDTTGGQARSVRYYLLGDEEATPNHPYYHEERTGYVALEFERGCSGVFVTIGIALRARRSTADKRVTPWSFVLTDGRRIGLDFDLIDRANHRPLSRQELRDVLGGGGQVFDDKQQQDYIERVNDLLFGFREDGFKRYLEVLLQVRRPKLGEGLTPEKVTGMLVDSLPSIDMRPIEQASDSFRRMDTIEAEIQRMEDQRFRADKLDELQRAAIQAAATFEAGELLRASKQYRGERAKLQAKEGELEKSRQLLEGSEEGIRESEEQIARIEGPLSSLHEELAEHGAFDIKKSLDAAVQDQERERGDLAAVEADLKTDSARRDDLQARRMDARERWSTWLGVATSLIQGLEASAERMAWPALRRRAEEARTSIAHASIEGEERLGSELVLGSLEGEVRERKERLGEVIAAREVLQSAEKQLGRADDAQRVAASEFKRADTAYADSVRDVAAKKEQAAEALQHWRDGLRELRIPEPELDAVQERVMGQEEESLTTARLLEPLATLQQAQAEDLNDAAGEVRDRLREAKAERAAVRKTIESLLGREEREPDRDDATFRARQALQDAGIAAAPLFAAVDFAADTLSAEQAARLEEVLEHAGLLDALVVNLAEVDRVDRILSESGLSDRWLRPAAEPGCAWLVPAEGATVDADSVQRALGALGGGDESTLGIRIALDGYWRTGEMEGRAPGLLERARFIGASNRRRERDRQLAEARDQLALLEAAIEDAEEEQRVVSARAATLRDDWKRALEMEALPLVGTALALRNRAHSTLEQKRDNLQMATDAARRAREHVEEKKLALDHVLIRAQFASKAATADDLRAMRHGLDALDKEGQALRRELKHAEDMRSGYRRLNEEIDNLLPRIASLNTRRDERRQRLTAAEAKVEGLRERYSEAEVGRDELSARVSALEAELKESTQGLHTHKEARVRAETQVAGLQPQVDDARGSVRTFEIGVEEARARLERRLLSYPTFDGEVVIARRDGWERFAADLVGQAGGLDADLATRKSEASQALIGAFHEHSSAFAGLGMRLEGESLIRCSSAEGDLLVIQLLHQLEEDLGRKAQARDDIDREIIEKVFLRTITDSIRDTMDATDRWINEVSEILEDMNFEEGRVMRLRWRVRERDATDGYDPQRLVQLFRLKAINLRDEQQEELVDIFRSMIEEARRRARDNQQTVDYRSALAGMLDYKQWYRLVIQRREVPGEFKDLTEKRYGKGSVGRRSLDLVLPLIAAVYGRLFSAGTAAPLLIGFDEAFAGVDDPNAAQIYALLDKLGFCWIMATEKATNYGPHIRGAVTYEFLKDGSTVAPIASVWDGQQRHSFEEDLIEMDSAISAEFNA